jgi:hypothetical protein
MLKRGTLVTGLAVFFALVMVFSGCEYEFNDKDSPDYTVWYNSKGTINPKDPNNHYPNNPDNPSNPDNPVAAGSSRQTAIPLTADSWTPGVLSAASPEVWYSYYISDYDYHCLMGRDNHNYEYTYTGDVMFEVYLPDTGTTPSYTLDAGAGGSFENPSGISGYDYLGGNASPGTWYVKVVRYPGEGSYGYGTYAIYFR